MHPQCQTRFLKLSLHNSRAAKRGASRSGLVLPFFPGRNYIRPPPPSPHLWAAGIFQGRGVGVYILRPHAAGILYAPLFHTPPTPRRVFQGWGGGVVKFGPVFLSFFVLFGTFPIFPEFSRFVRRLSGVFPICPSLSLGLLTAPTRNSPERVRDTIWTFPEKSGKPPGLETPRFSSSQTARICRHGHAEKHSTHRVLQGAAHWGGRNFASHLCGSPDPFFMQRNEPFLPQNLHPREGKPLKHRLINTLSEVNATNIWMCGIRR